MVEAVLHRLCEVLAQRIDEWRSGGFEPIRRQWLERAWKAGEPVEVSIGAATVQGRFEGLDADGALRLATAEGTRRITAGDVRFAPV